MDNLDQTVAFMRSTDGSEHPPNTRHSDKFFKVIYNVSPTYWWGVCMRHPCATEVLAIGRDWPISCYTLSLFFTNSYHFYDVTTNFIVHLNFELCDPTLATEPGTLNVRFDKYASDLYVAWWTKPIFSVKPYWEKCNDLIRITEKKFIYQISCCYVGLVDLIITSLYQNWIQMVKTTTFHSTIMAWIFHWTLSLCISFHTYFK